MGLTDIVTDEIKKVKNFFFTPDNKADMIKYLSDVELGKYFDKAPADKKQEMYKSLENHVQRSMDKYKDSAKSWYTRAANIGGVATTLVDAYDLFLSKVPLPSAKYLPIPKLMILLKTMVEIPHMYNYLKESKDLVGLIKWLGMKPIELAIPILGPMMGVGWTEKIVRQRIMYEAKRNFLKEMGHEVKQPYKTIDEHVKGVTGYDIQPQYAG